MGADSDQVKGKAKEVVGSVTGDEDLEAEGTADRLGGEAKEKVEDVKDTVKDVLHKVGDKAEEAIDKVKDALHRK
jgi:uncharacterized protein YjbJ (UPF0337 family)